MTKATTRTRRKRPPLDADRIAAEAVALVDEEGLDALSFRALAKRLGCEAMSLYHHLPSKAHLLDAMVNICIAETPPPPRGPSPRERICTFAMAYRETAIRHPGVARVFLVHRMNHREGLAWLNGIVDIFEDAGLPPETGARLFRAIGYYLMGANLDEAMGYERGPSAAEPVPPEEAARDFPAIMRLGAHFGADNRRAFFDAGLEVMLDWLDDELDRAAARHTGTEG